jgi:hypothetical protein
LVLRQNIYQIHVMAIEEHNYHCFLPHV